MKKKQAVIIHGGNTFRTNDEFLKYLQNKELDFESLRSPTNDWKRNLAEDLGDGFEVLRPHLPNGHNAQYAAWKIWFEKIIPYLNKDIVLIGHSLGGIFLVKYLAENNVPKTIRAVYLVGAPFNNEDGEMTDEFNPPKSLEAFEKQCGSITLYHSKDDPIVPFENFEKYKTKLTTAHFVEYADRKHFFDEHFPELVEDIKAL